MIYRNIISSHSDSERAFTLVEVILVIVVLGVAYAMIVPRMPSVQYWREEAMVRKLSETIMFLHRQAVNDDVFYQMEFDLDGKLQGCDGTPCYRIGEIVPEDDYRSEEDPNYDEQSNLGMASLELNLFLYKDLGSAQNVQPPSNFPSLEEPIKLEDGTYFEGIRTVRGVSTPGDKRERPFIIFSPRGFSEFCVIHLQLTPENNKVTILVNPFTGITDIYRGSEFRDFEWKYS